jgi:hypothetical protein
MSEKRGIVELSAEIVNCDIPDSDHTSMDTIKPYRCFSGL